MLSVDFGRVENWLAALALANLLVIQGCASDAGRPDKVRELPPGVVLHNSLQCGGGISQASAIRIDNPERLKQRYRLLSRQAEETLIPPLLDFSRESVVLIAMGQRQTGGYLLNYQSQPIRFDGETLAITLSWQEPLPGYKQAQILTSPCLLLKLPTVPIERIRILDQDGVVRVDNAAPGTDS